MKGLIVSGGSRLDKDELKKYCKTAEVIVAADRGIEVLLEIDCKVNYLIGDFDSINQDVFKKVENCNIKIIRHPKEKDDTDTELAINLLLDLACDEIDLVGVTGTRLDHTLANISILRKLYHKGVDARIIDNNNIIQYLSDEISLTQVKDYYVSLVPISLDGLTVTLEGFFFPLDKKKIEYGSSLGISNYLTKFQGRIIKHKGEGLLIQARD